MAKVSTSVKDSIDPKAPAEKTEKKTATIVKKEPTDWTALLKRADEHHWRMLLVTIQIRGKLFAGKPKALDAETAMIKARGLEDVLEAKEITDPAERAEKAEEVKDEGICEFYRREGRPGIWFPSFQIKAMLKENWSALGFAKKLRGTRGRLAECVFAFGTDYDDREWIFLGDSPDGIETNVCHTTGSKGPQASIKRNEYKLRPKLTFVVQIAREIADDLPDEELATTLFHASRHGLGANRSQGVGTFDVVGIEEVQSWPKK